MWLKIEKTSNLQVQYLFIFDPPVQYHIKIMIMGPKLVWKGQIIDEISYFVVTKMYIEFIDDLICQCICIRDWSLQASFSKTL